MPKCKQEIVISKIEVDLTKWGKQRNNDSNLVMLNLCRWSHLFRLSVLRGHLWDKKKVDLYDRWPLKRASIHMKCSMIGQEKGDL
jgi:hypothetical protein